MITEEMTKEVIVNAIAGSQKIRIGNRDFTILVTMNLVQSCQFQRLLKETSFKKIVSSCSKTV